MLGVLLYRFFWIKFTTGFILKYFSILILVRINQLTLKHYETSFTFFPNHF